MSRYQEEVDGEDEGSDGLELGLKRREELLRIVPATVKKSDQTAAESQKVCLSCDLAEYAAASRRRRSRVP